MSRHYKDCGCVDCAHRASPIAEHLAARSTARPDGCVIFTGKLRADGYGRLIRNGMEYRAHRVALALRLGYADGVLPLDVVVRHQCDNPPCVNPDHLLVGSQADNMRDAKVRGRSKGPHSWSVDALGVLRCSKGHDLSADRSIEASSDGSRRCLLCRQENRGSTPRRFRNGR